MGVYRARDLKLNRDVALKVLPPAFAVDPDRLARFRPEDPHSMRGGLQGAGHQRFSDAVTAILSRFAETKS